MSVVNSNYIRPYQMPLESEQTCCICMDHAPPSDQKTPWVIHQGSGEKHPCHRECLTDWFLQQRTQSNYSCPVCKMDLNERQINCLTQIAAQNVEGIEPEKAKRIQEKLSAFSAEILSKEKVSAQDEKRIKDAVLQEKFSHIKPMQAVKETLRAITPITSMGALRWVLLGGTSRLLEEERILEGLQKQQEELEGALEAARKKEAFFEVGVLKIRLVFANRSARIQMKRSLSLVDKTMQNISRYIRGNDVAQRIFLDAQDKKRVAEMALAKEVSAANRSLISAVLTLLISVLALLALVSLIVSIV